MEKGEKESRERSLSTKHQKCRRTLSAYFYLRVQHPQAGQKGERRRHFPAYIRFIASSRAASHLCFFLGCRKISGGNCWAAVCFFKQASWDYSSRAQLLPWDSSRRSLPKMYTPQPLRNCISAGSPAASNVFLNERASARSRWIVESIVTPRNPPK